MNTRHKSTAAERAEQLVNEAIEQLSAALKPTDLLDNDSDSSEDFNYEPLSAEDKFFLQQEYEEERRGLLFSIFFFESLQTIYL